MVTLQYMCAMRCICIAYVNIYTTICAGIPARICENKCIYTSNIQVYITFFMHCDTIRANGGANIVTFGCAGIARRLDLNVTGLRWVVAFVTLFLSGVPAIVYLVLWAVLKPRPTSGVIDV